MVALVRCWWLWNSSDSEINDDKDNADGNDVTRPDHVMVMTILHYPNNMRSDLAHGIVTLIIAPGPTR